MELDEFRLAEIDRLYDAEVVSGIKMHFLPGATEKIMGFLDDVFDADGDTFVARAELLFPLDGEGLVQATFAQGTDPRYASRCLRKMADMLDGPQGLSLANMAKGPGNCDTARRNEDLSLNVCNAREYVERYIDEAKRQEKWKGENSE